MNAVSLHSTVNHIGQIIGPAAAGGIIELAGIGTPLMVKTVLAMTLRANSVRDRIAWGFSAGPADAAARAARSIWQMTSNKSFKVCFPGVNEGTHCYPRSQRVWRPGGLSRALDRLGARGASGNISCPWGL